MGKRILSLLLAFVMVVGMIPASAFGVFAAETEQLDDVVAHIAAGTASIANGAVAGAPTVDGVLSDHVWIRPTVLTATGAVTGMVSAAWAKGKLYLGVEFTGATQMTVKLGDKTWNLTLSGTDITSDDSAVTGKLGTGVAELVIDMVKAGVNISAYGQKAVFGMSLTDGTNTADLGNRNILFSADPVEQYWSYSSAANTTVPATKDVYTLKTSAGQRGYCYLTKSAIDHSKDIYFEHTLTIRDLAESTGNYVDGKISQGNGYGFWIADQVGSTSNADFMLSLLYVQNGELYMKLRATVNGSATYVPFATGIPFTSGTPVTLKVGYLWESDNTASFYINGEKKGTVEGSLLGNYGGYGKEMFMFNTYGVADLTITDPAFTVGRGYTAPTYTTAKVLNGVDTTAVADNLPTTYAEGNFAFNLTWQSSNPAVIAADGTVTQPVGADATVEVSAVVGGEILEAVSVTVPEAEAVAEGTYEAFVAEDITVDGNLNEVAWRTGAKLGKGQPFDILWDGGNLYFGVVAADGDESMTVKIGDEVVATAAKAGSGFEVMVPYTTKGVTTLENVTITVGKSVWKGSVDLVKMARKEGAVQSEMSCGAGTNATGTVTATADGNGIVFDLPARAEALSTTSGAVGTLYAMKNPAEVMKNRTGNIALEFKLDPEKLIVVPSGSVGVDNTIWSGMEVIWVDYEGTAVRFGIANTADGLILNSAQTVDAKNSPIRGTINLGKTMEDGAFDVKVLWKTDGSIEVFVEGVSKGTVENTVATAQAMDLGNYTANNMLHIRATRYDYNTKQYYKEDVKFTVSDIKLSKVVEVTYVGDPEEETETATGTYDAFVASDITLDGNMNELAWRTGAKLGGGQPFDILFDGNNLYFGVVADAADETMTVKIGDEVVATAAKAGSGFEAKVEYLTKDIAKIEGVTITVGKSVWTGDVNLNRYSRVYKYEPGKTGMVNGFQYFNNSPKPDGNLAYTVNGNAITMSNRYIEGKQNAINGRVYSLETGVTVAQNRTDDRVIEFDFIADSLPSYTNTSNIGVAYPAYGFTGVLAETANDGITFGIMKASEDGKLYLNIAWQTTDSDKDAACKKYVKYIALDKSEGELFSVRLVWSAENNVSVYVDGVLKGTVENCLHKGLAWTNTFGFNLWGPGSMCALTADGKNDNIWTVSNVRISKAVEVKSQLPNDGGMSAMFTDVEPKANYVGWNNAIWEDFANGTGKVAALVYNQKVYLAVNAIGSVSATLGEETKTATANGITVLSFDATTVTKYGQEIALTVSLDGNAVWETEGKLTVGQAVVNSVHALENTKGLILSGVVTATSDALTIVTTDEKPMYDHQHCAYWIQNNVGGIIGDSYDPTKDVLLEQTLKINSMPVGDVTGGYQNTPPTPANGWGYTIMFEVPSLTASGKFDQFSNVVYADKDGKLYLRGIDANAALLTPVALGKSLGEEFKLGLLYGLDNTTTVFVDDVELVTYENTRYIGGTYKVPTVMVKYMDPADKIEGQNVNMVAKNFSLTNVGVYELIDLEEEISKEAIFGEMDLSNVTADLALVTTFQSAYLGVRNLRWTSSDETVVEKDGSIHPIMDSDRKSTLSVYLDDSSTALWSVEVTVPASSTALNALLSEETMSVDGQLSERAWLDWMKFASKVPGHMAAAWSKGNVFFGIYSEEAETLKLTVNGKVMTVNMATGVISGVDGAIAVRNAKTGATEIGIPLSALGINLTDYNQFVTFNAVLSKGETNADLNAVLLNFSGDVAELQPLASYTKDAGPWTLLTNSISYNGTAPGKRNYAYKADNNIDHKQLTILSHEFQFDALPVTTGAQTTAAQADGFHYYFSDEDANTRKGTTIFVAIFNDGGETLKLRIGQGGGQDGYVFDLGKTLGEKFRLTYYWYPNNDLDIFVDGVLIGTVKNAGYATSYLGVDVVCYNYWSEKASMDKVKLTVSNQTVITTKYESVLDELTKNAIFGRVDLDHVQKDLPMVTTFASANFDALNLRWTSSNEDAVATDGTIKRHATEAQSSVVTVYFVDGEGNEIKLWDVTVTVDPMTVKLQPAPSIIHTGFAAPGSVKIDGSVEDTESWLLNGWVLNDAGQPVGYFGTQWDQENLYVLLDTEAQNVTLSLGGKEIPVTKTGNITELAIPVSELLNTAKIEQYGVAMVANVTMDGYTYRGTLHLTNVDWWATDNIYAGLPMLDNNVKSVKLGTSDIPDGNQGAKQLENGWHLYDLYNENGTNPAGIRTYVLFMKMPVYENFADRTEATHVEFDFYAKALPEWEWDEAIKNEVGRAFANYGVTFSMSDKADAAKNSNVAVFGIVNTADEGLVLVVNRGTEDYEHFVLNKNVGEEFRIGMTWLTNANLVLTIDGVEITTIHDMSKFVNAVGDTSFVVNMIRNKEKPTGADDDMDVYLTNIGFGKAHATENIIRNLTFADIAGNNESENEITDNLNLIPYMTNGQLDNQYPITWTSSNEDVIDPATGEVKRPEKGVKVVTLTATLDNNGVTETKEFRLTVYGTTVSNGNALVVSNDTNPFGMAAEAYVGILYTLDQTNNSIVYAFPEDAEPTQINLITLTDLDEVSRLNRESLRLFVSDDNVAYTEIEDYKLHHDGCNWYLYDFEATARYIKVHYTHRDKDGADFLNAPGDMIDVSWNESLVIPTDAAEIAVPTATLLDQAVAIELPEGVETAGLRVALGSELLFHYVDKDGTVYVRIPNKETGVLKLWNASAEDIELADKENVYEVTYGTRETLPASGRWILGLKAGQTFPDQSSLAVDTLYQMGGKTVRVSTDGGYTWNPIGSVTHSTNLSSGGWGIDSKTGRLFHEFYFAASTKSGDAYDAFHGSDIDSSYCPTHVFYSDDGGKTWHDTEGLDKIDGDIYSNYVLSYTDFTELAGNDGNNTDPAKGGDEKGGAVDFVFPMGAQFNNNGAFCGRVAYTRDGGLSWHYSDSLITFGNETAFEGGVSEATILEREDGTLVYYARCQSSGVDNFTISYSLDHGVTWLTPGLTSSIYTTNTQALMMTYDFDGFDGNRLTGEPIFMWGGNNVLGGNSYMRMPLNFAVSTNGMDTFRNIQNIFSETFMDDYTFTADHYITNPSIQQINGHDMYVAFSRLRQNDSIYMVVNNFTDWFTRTKGAYDSFENAIAWYEGWSLYKGVATTTNEKSSDGKYSMLVKENTQVTRSIPYLQNGKLSIDLYVDAASNFVFELQPAFSNLEMKCAVVSAKVNGTTMTLHDGTVLTLNSGWNTVTFDLELTENSASIGINGGDMKDFAVNTKFNGNTFDKSGTEYELGNYITYVTILATSNVYVDEFFVESSLDAVTEATQADKAAADTVVEQIKAVLAAPTKESIAAAKQAYAALSQVRKDLVNRNVPTGTSTNANDEGALINYYQELLKVEAIFGDLEISSGEGTGDVAEGVEGITPDQVQDAANDVTTQENLNDAIANAVETDYSEHVDAAIEALESADKYNPQKKLDIELRPSLKIQVKEVTENAMKVDIEAVYAVYAIQDGVEEMTAAGLQPLDTTGQTITIKLPLPAGFVSSVNEKVFINHYDSEGGLKATHEGTVSADETNGFFVTFENDLGFSEFVLYTHRSVSDKVKLDAYTLTLEDMVGLNFYMVLGDDVAEDENAYMQFSIGDRVIRVGKDQRRVVTDRTGTYYVYTCPVYAKEMNDQVTAQFFYDGGTSGLIRYSVRKYADYVLGHPDSYNPELVALMKEMLQYGAYAQMNFNHNTDNLANTGITATDVSTVDAATLRGMSYSFDGATTNVAAYGISLVLEENVTMKFFFNISGDPSAITVTRDGVAQELKPVGNNVYCVEVTGIAAKELNEKITLQVVDGNETKEFSSSPISYCYIIAFIDDTASATLKDLCKSLYLYHEAAKAYFNR